VVTETATTIEPYFTLDLSNAKRFYKQKTASKLKPSLH